MINSPIKLIFIEIKFKNFYYLEGFIGRAKGTGYIGISLSGSGFHEGLFFNGLTGCSQLVGIMVLSTSPFEVGVWFAMKGSMVGTMALSTYPFYHSKGR